MHRKSGLLRLGAAAFGLSAMLLTGALPAAADEATAEIDTGAGTSGYRIALGEGYGEMATTLFTLDLDGGNSLRAYCVEIDVRVDPSRGLSEKPWDGFPNPDSPFHDNRDRINWVLHHGYPAVGTESLEETLAEAGVEVRDGLTDREAITATQAAVWHFSDGKDIDRENPVPHAPEAAADVLGLYDYLTGENNVGIGDQPAPALDVSPDELSGAAGERLGPFTVSTTGEITGLTSDLPEGVTLTDADGNPVTAADIAHGSEVYLDVPADAVDGEGSFTLAAQAHVDTGRLFVSENYQRKPAQSLIVASSDKTTLSTSASASWTAAPPATTTPETTPTEAPPTSTETSEVAAPPTSEATPSPQATSGDLAQTGFSAATPLVIGAVLVAAGAATLLLQRRRRS